MNRLPHESNEDLTKKLRAVLEESGTPEDGAPEDVFADGAGGSDSDTKDEQIAAFDSYMAELLGEMGVADGVLTSTVAPTEMPEQPKQDDRVDDEQMLDFTDESAPDEIDVPTPASVQEDVASAESDLPIFEPDEQAELEYNADEALEDETEQITSDDETLTVAESAEFEVLEQLDIESQTDMAEQQEKPEEPLLAEEELPGEIEEILPAAQESAEPVDEPLDEAMAADEPVDDVPSTQEAEAQEEIAPVELREGDLLLDADDEIPAPTAPVEPQVQEDERIELQADAKEPEETNADVVPTPVASPLDAARENEMQKQADVPAPRPKQSPLDAMAAKNKGNVASFGISSAISGRQNRERTLTDQDVELLLDLGYDANLTQKVGSQRVESIRYRRQEDEKTKRKLRRAYGCVGEEYTGHTQDKQIAAQYKKHSVFALTRLVLTMLISLALVGLDLLPTVRDRLPAAFSSEAVIGFCLLLGMLLVCLSAMLAWPMILRGAKALIRLSPEPCSVATLLLLFTLLYDVALLFFGFGDVTLHFPMGVVLILLCIGEVMTVKREQLTFEVVSAHSRKIVMEPLPPRKKKVVRDGHIVKIMDDEVQCRRFRVRPTDQVTGYFRRNGESTPRYRALSPLLVVSFAIALLVSVVTLIVTEQMAQTGISFLLTLHLCLPVTALISYAYPMLVAAWRLTPQGCAVVGHGAVDEYAGEKLLMFDDTEMFRSKSSTEITIKGSGDTKKYIRYAKRLFRTLGGTLRGISTSDLSEEAYEERVEILKLFEQGVEARIDGKVSVLAGTSAFMVCHGVRVPDQSAELLVRRNVESSILYLAFDGKLRLGYEVDYRMSGRFEQMVTQLASLGTAVAIETCDPCIYDDFLSRSRHSQQTPISVVKPVRFERHTESLICDSGVIATRSARDIARATAMCDALLENDKRLIRFQRVMSVLGGALVLGLSLFGSLSYSASLLVAAAQALLCLPVIALSRRRLTNEYDSEKKNGKDI